VYWFRRIFLAFLMARLCLASSAAVEMPYVPPELADRPPVAAPTARIEVAPITTVRSQSEKLGDFSAGLIRGLMSRVRSVRGVAFVAVQGDHVIVQNAYGSVTPETAFEVGSMADLLAAIAAMHEVERTSILLDEDIATILKEPNRRNITTAQILTHQAGDFPLLVTVIERASGQMLPVYLQANVFMPLGMNPGTGTGPLKLDATGLSHLMIALVNGGTYGGATILQPATVDLMERTHFTEHQALPGWSYGFQEMRRNNWRALQRDGESPSTQMRLVIVPDAKLAYLVAVDGRGDAQFWRTLDEALFDSAFPPQGANDAGLRGTAPPTADEARAAAGSYEPGQSYAANVAPLKNTGRRLAVAARGDGALALSGAEEAVLNPKAGGFWANDDGNVVAAMRDGHFVISSGVFAPLALWKRPLFYALLALLAAIAGAGVGYYEFGHRKRSFRVNSAAVLAPAGVMAILIFVSLIAWLVALNA
jgi:CubicO group peptidase (beta-lactamase class C family)